MRFGSSRRTTNGCVRTPEDRQTILQRQKVHEWIDASYRDEGFDPEQAEAASDALIERLETTTDQSARSAWERLVDLFAAGGDAADGD